MHRARKRFGQNFLHDRAVITRIIAAIHPRAGEALVEIGPGLGALTCELLKHVDALDVVELDRDVIPLLEQACRGLGTLHVRQADALHFDFAALMHDTRKLRLVGNLPYNIATPLLFHLFTQLHAIRDMHFMLQKEVVERMVAAPGTEHYGRLSLMVQFHCTAYQLFTVGPGAFKPAPKVDSAIVRLIPHAAAPVDVPDIALFSALVAKAFSQRRKTVRNALKGMVDDMQFAACGIDSGTRAEQLALEDFACLSRSVAHA